MTAGSDGERGGLRILHCLTYDLPHRTGLTLHVRRLAEAQARLGHAVTVLSARFRRDLPRDGRAGGVRVVRLAAPLRVSRGMIMPAYPLALWRLVGGHDVVHVHSPMLETPLVALVCRLRGKPLVVTHHGDLVLPGGALNRFIESLVARLWRPAARAAARLIAYSDDYAAHSRYLRPFRDKVTAVPPPVTVPPVDPDRVAALRRRLGLEGRRVVGYAGRFVEEKRPDLLLAALAPVRAALPDVAAVFAGQVDLPYERYVERCRAQIVAQADAVRFTGLLDDDAELAAFYALCDVLVLPSQSECFGLVQVEAMLCGTPVVATDIPGARVPVRETGMGVLVPPGDPAALAEAIVRVVREPAPYLRPRAAIEQAFSLDATVSAVLDVLLMALTAGEADPAFRHRVVWVLSRLELNDGQRVLELGAGIAPLLMLAQRPAALRPVAVDLSIARLARARRRGYRGPGVVADAASLPFAAGTFERVIASEVLEHVADDAAALAELRAATAAGALVGVTVPHARYPFAWDPIARVLEALGVQPPRSGPYVGIWTGHRRLYLRDRLRGLCEAAGWRVVAEGELVRGSFPFAHFLLYGVGKRLLDAGLVGRATRAAVDRSGAAAALPPPWHPVGAMIRLLRRFDARAERRARPGRSVHLAALLRNPDRNQM